VGRAPFDRLVDTFNGPDTPTPYGPLLTALPARVVADLAFKDLTDPMNQSLAYMTYDAGFMNGPEMTYLGGQFYNVAYGAADMVALITGGPVTHQAVRIESRTWPDGTNYYRAHLIPRQDVPPSVCSTSYASVYYLQSAITPLATLLRIGPTSWEGDGYLLLAEVTGPPGAGCSSMWKLYLGTEVWQTLYTGITNQIFTSPGPGPITSRFVIPGP